MPKSIRILIWLSGNVIRYATALGIVGWTYRFVRDLVDGMGLSLAMATSLFGLGATIFLGLAVTYAIEFYLDRGEDRHMARALADVLEDRISVGETKNTTLNVADRWAALGGFDRRDLRHNTLFRWIKLSVDYGHVSGQPLNAQGNANRDTVIQFADLSEVPAEAGLAPASRARLILTRGTS